MTGIQLGHIVYDVIPWYALGNSPNDPTTIFDRLGITTYDGDTGRFYENDCNE